MEIKIWYAYWKTEKLAKGEKATKTWTSVTPTRKLITESKHIEVDKHDQKLRYWGVQRHSKLLLKTTTNWYFSNLTSSKQLLEDGYDSKYI